MSQSTVRADISITPAEGAVHDGYAVYWRRLGERLWSPRGYSGVERIILDDMPTQGVYEIAVAPITAGLEMPPEQWTIRTWSPEWTSDFVTPTAPGNFRVGQEGASLVAAWDAITDPYVSHVELRLGSSWDDGILVARVPAPAASVRFGAWWTGFTVVKARAVTWQGIGSSLVAASINVEEDSYAPVTATADESGGGFAATKTGTEVSSSKLRIAKLPAAASGWSGTASGYTHPAYLSHLGSGTYVTAWQDRGAVVRERVEAQLSAAAESTSFTASAWRMPARSIVNPGDRGIGDRLLPSGAPRDGLDVTVEIDTAQDGVPTADGWRVWIPGTVYLFRQYRLRLTLRAIGLASVEVTTLKHRGRRLNRKDEVAVTITATGGTTVTFTTPFTAAPKATATVIGTTGLFATVSDLTSGGCSVRAWDAAGVEQSSATVHVLALGI